MPLIWCRLNLDTHENPKLLRLINAPNGAVAGHVWLAAIEFAVKWNTDGYLTRKEMLGLMPSVGVNSKHILLLVSHGFLDAVDGKPPGYCIHDFGEYQAAADTARAMQERMRNAANARWAGHRNGHAIKGKT